MRSRSSPPAVRPASGFPCDYCDEDALLGARESNGQTYRTGLSCVAHGALLNRDMAEGWKRAEHKGRIERGTAPWIEGLPEAPEDDDAVNAAAEEGTRA